MANIFIGHFEKYIQHKILINKFKKYYFLLKIIQEKNVFISLLELEFLH